MIKFEKFDAYISKVEKNLSKRSFTNRLLFECLYDEQFGEEVIKYLDCFNSNLTSEDLGKIFQRLRDRTVHNFEMSKKSSGRDSLDFCMRSLAYYYFLECLDEYSTFSEQLIERIKEKYGDRYIEIIASADKAYVSQELQGIEGNVANAESLISDDLICQYLVLKKWQDSQHYFFDGDYRKYVAKLHTEFLGNLKLSPFKLEQEALKKRLKEDVVKSKVIDVDTVASLTKVIPKEDVVELFGGKMYGLAILYANHVKVPHTVVIPVNTSVKQNDLEFLRGKFKAFSVRSSADIEDGEHHSFAGMFDSYLDVSFDDLIGKIELVKASVNSERVSEYVKLNGLKSPNMAVVIQSFEEPTIAGVWIANSMHEGMLEWVEGNGEKLVSGSETPHSEYVCEENIDERFIKVGEEFVAQKLLNVQAKLGKTADFEWMILNGELVLLQFRPVTRTVNVGISDFYKVETSENEFCGIAASAGAIVGTPQYLESPDEAIKPGNILLARITDPDWVPNLLRAGGAVTSRGGFLCHTAIICRELGIPCITAVGDKALEVLANAQLIEVYGNKGIVKVK